MKVNLTGLFGRFLEGDRYEYVRADRQESFIKITIRDLNEGGGIPATRRLVEAEISGNLPYRVEWEGHSIEIQELVFVDVATKGGHAPDYNGYFTAVFVVKEWREREEGKEKGE